MEYTNTIHIADGLEGWVKEGYFVYNKHGEFILSIGRYHKKEPVVDHITK